MDPLKLILTSKTNLQKKYSKNFPPLIALLNKVKKADKLKHLRTEIVFIDDSTSMKKFKVKKAASISAREFKGAVDRLYNKLNPAYMVIFGSQDVFPFQELINPTDDEDKVIPSDLPYACTAAYSKKANKFTGPSRVLGRVPDVPGAGDLTYVTAVIDSMIKHQPLKESDYRSYFAISAKVWKKSTELSLKSMFGNNMGQRNSPPASGKYTKTELKPRTHFYNCHGAIDDPNFFGQDGNKYPSAMHTKDLAKKITPGTIVAAECCYGAQVFDPVKTGIKVLSISSQYLLQRAIAFMGSSTIAYGPSDSQGLADLITQYFIKHLLEGASTGRAMLEAQQEFLLNSGPDLDPYELKTLAQFYLLGDPSLQAVSDEPAKGLSGDTTIENRRKNLYVKGQDLERSVNPSNKISQRSKRLPRELSALLRKARIDRKAAREHVYKVPNKTSFAGAKRVTLPGSKFLAFVRETKSHGTSRFRVLVVKESDDQVLGWRVYLSR